MDEYQAQYYDTIKRSCQQLARTIDDINQKFSNDEWILSEYQRGEVWQSKNQGIFIDSIRKRFYVIPPLIISYVSEPDKYEILDGGNRLRSIQKFMKGEIPQIDGDSKMFIWYKEVDDYKQKVSKMEKVKTTDWKHAYLNKKQQDKFKNIDLNVQICPEDLTEDEKREIFYRLQYGVPPTSSTKLRSNMNNPISKFYSKHIVSHDVMKEFSRQAKQLKGSGIGLKEKDERGFRAVYGMIRLSDGKSFIDNALADDMPNPKITLEWLSGNKELIMLTLKYGCELLKYANEYKFKINDRALPSMLNYIMYYIDIEKRSYVDLMINNPNNVAIFVQIFMDSNYFKGNQVSDLHHGVKDRVASYFNQLRNI